MVGPRIQGVIFTFPFCKCLCLPHSDPCNIYIIVVVSVHSMCFTSSYIVSLFSIQSCFVLFFDFFFFFIIFNFILIVLFCFCWLLLLYYYTILLHHSFIIIINYKYNCIILFFSFVFLLPYSTTPHHILAHYFRPGAA